MPYDALYTFLESQREDMIELQRLISARPAEDVFYADFRILSEYTPTRVIQRIQLLCQDIEADYGIKVEFAVLNSIESPPTPAESTLVHTIQRCTKTVDQVDVAPSGTGSSIVAAFLRNAGYETAAWDSLENCAHQANEYCVIQSMINDAKVRAAFMLELGL